MLASIPWMYLAYAILLFIIVILRRSITLKDREIAYLNDEIDRLVPGSNCGLCGKWVEGDPGDRAYPPDWRWTVCPECLALGDLSEKDFERLLSSGALKAGLSRPMQVEHLLREHAGAKQKEG